MDGDGHKKLRKLPVVFGYDDLYRLTSASGIYGAITYTYDKVGNRLSRTQNSEEDTYLYYPGTNLLNIVSGKHPEQILYDSDGNTTQRIPGVTNPAPDVTDPADYFYNSGGQRVKKDNSVDKVFHYDLAGQLIAETDATGSLIKAYVRLHGEPLTQIASNGEVSYYHNDHLGTPQKMTDAAGAEVWAADYLPFGRADVTIGTVENHLRFAGQYFDAGTGLHYNYQRHYDPSTGRDLTPDPIGLAGGINLYLYAATNPTNLIDPLGLDYVNFDGQKFTWVFEKRASIFGIPMPWKEETGRKSWDARSGKSPLYVPIPSGTYTTSASDKVYHAGQEVAWGPFSYRLHESLMTRVFNRLEGRTGGFHIHGGYEEGTAGCVEFEDYDPAQTSLHEFDKLMQNYGREIKIYVE